MQKNDYIITITYQLYLYSYYVGCWEESWGSLIPQLQQVAVKQAYTVAEPLLSQCELVNATGLAVPLSIRRSTSNDVFVSALSGMKEQSEDLGLRSAKTFSVAWKSCLIYMMYAWCVTGIVVSKTQRNKQNLQHAFLLEAGEVNNVAKVCMFFSSKYGICVLCNEGLFFLFEYKKAIHPSVSYKG